MKNIYLCIITGQPLANLIPILQEKPEHIVLIHTKDYKDKADNFIKTLIKAEFSEDQIDVYGDLPLNKFDNLRMYAMKLLDEKILPRFKGYHLTWNATGGTKQMALAIWDVLDRTKDRIIYCDTRNGVIEIMTPEPAKIKLKSLLSPEIYLNALGKIKRNAQSDDEKWVERADSWKQATRYLGENAQALVGFFIELNKQLDNNVGAYQSISFNFIGKDFREALNLLTETGVLDEQEDNSFRPMNPDAVQYLTGGWLEEFVWHMAKNQKLDYVECGLKFGDLKKRKKGQDNEIDTFIIHNNRVIVIECKSGRMANNSIKDSNIIYKLDSLGLHAGGAQATRILVSAQPLEHENKKGRKVDTRARAIATDVFTVESEELKTLGKRLLQWKDDGQWH